MIQITDKSKCCGCEACAQVCPRKCISMVEDAEGFCYPVVVENNCVGCGKCLQVCPCANMGESRSPIKSFVAQHSEEAPRAESSSGGVFSALAERVLAQGGVVFGARFDEHWEVVHGFVETSSDLGLLRGSKYLQSRIGDAYQQVREFLQMGRQVLFSGTPCQVAGLHRFLGQKLDGLFLVAILCHSVPSVAVWRRYLAELSGGSRVLGVNFRDKSTGWSHYRYSLVVDTPKGRILQPGGGQYMQGLTANLTTRPSCSCCPARHGRSGADIVLGDGWGLWDIMPELDDNRGSSLVLVLTDQGMQAIDALDIGKTEVDVSKMFKYNGGLTDSHAAHPMRDYFFSLLPTAHSVERLIGDMLYPPKSLWQKFRAKIRKLIKRKST